MVYGIKEAFPCIDGYYAIEVPSLQHVCFHSEMCVFESYVSLERTEHRNLDSCSDSDAFRDLLKQGLDGRDLTALDEFVGRRISALGGKRRSRRGGRQIQSYMPVTSHIVDRNVHTQEELDALISYVYCGDGGPEMQIKMEDLDFSEDDDDALLGGARKSKRLPLGGKKKASTKRSVKSRKSTARSVASKGKPRADRKTAAKRRPQTVR
jgi:hypothetical protein